MKPVKQSAEIKAIASKLKRHFGRTLENASKEEMYRASAMCIRDEIAEQWVAANAEVEKKKKKRVYYLSAEFLLGRAYVNNLVNLGLMDKYQKALQSLGLSVDEISKMEPDAGLGNGGLGRLAACFLESLATQNLPAMGCGIRYEYGLFKQVIVDGQQVEMEDNWLEDGCVWEIARPEQEVEVHFGGYVDEQWTEGGMVATHRDYNTVIAVPYDMPIVGYKSKIPATLRLWGAKSKEQFDFQSFSEGDYAKSLQERELAESISKVLYPSDNHDQGKQLRLKQFYFFTSATMQYMVSHHKRHYGDLHSLPKYAAVQINDTHPTLAIPELMRILLDEEGYSWEESYGIVSQLFNYTNHTILQEALETWDEGMFKLLLPRIYSIIQELNNRYTSNLNRYYPGDMERISKMSIVAYGQIRMANLCVAVARRVNGVSQLHGAILKQSLFADSYEIYPNKFLAITNGITHRRWLAVANPELCALMKEYIGDGFLKDYREFEKLLDHVDDARFLKKFMDVKQKNKERLAQFVWDTQEIHVKPDSFFDVQAKRLHEYKRQLMKCLHILHLYNTLQSDPDAVSVPITFFFAAKAAPGYARAKAIIRLIHAIAELINGDPVTRDKLQVVFIENYGVSKAEVLIPATDLSEQLSTAGLEASGTGNMKFMMNGALTIGTMDGANVEIYEEVGPDNIYIFGANVDEIHAMENHKSYRPGEIFERNLEVRDILDRLVDGTLPGSQHQFSDIYQSLLFGDFGFADRYFVLHDLPDYIAKFNRAYKRYCDDREGWAKMAATNTAHSGFFSSDRTILEYNDKIWGLESI